MEENEYSSHLQSTRDEPALPTSADDSIVSSDLPPAVDEEIHTNEPTFSEPAEDFLPTFRIAPPPPTRIPHVGHVALVALNLIAAVFVVTVAFYAVVKLHLFGIKSFSALQDNIGLQLAHELFSYLLAFMSCYLVLPLLWDRPFFKALSWRVSAVPKYMKFLITAAFVCLVIAVVSTSLIPTPKDAPIDHVFQKQGAPWLLFAFGVTAAPFFEELAFRGFLLPSLATAFDWFREHTQDFPRQPLASDGTPQWSTIALLTSSVVTSALFACMHGPQVAWSIAALLLLSLISLILCAVRILTHSLAASTFVHAVYNLIIFSSMILATNGFHNMNPAGK